MKKKSSRQHKVKRRDLKLKAKNKTKTKKSVTMNIAQKSSHDREITVQLNMCEEFIDKVNDTLQLYGGQLDTMGVGVLGDNHKECIQILNTIDADLKSFYRQYEAIAAEAKDFIKSTDGEAYEWTSNSIRICTDLNSLRDEHTHLYMLNHQALSELLD